MRVQEGNLLYMRETDLGYFWVPNGKQMSRFEVATVLDYVSIWPVAPLDYCTRLRVVYVYFPVQLQCLSVFTCMPLGHNDATRMKTSRPIRL
jgi:hypothetical protein